MYEARYPRAAPISKMRDERRSAQMRFLARACSAVPPLALATRGGDGDGTNRETRSSSRLMKCFLSTGGLAAGSGIGDGRSETFAGRGATGRNDGRSPASGEGSELPSSPPKLPWFVKDCDPIQSILRMPGRDAKHT